MTADVFAFLEYIQVQLEKHQRRVANADAPEVYREQGAIQALSSIIRDIKQDSFKQGEVVDGNE